MAKILKDTEMLEIVRRIVTDVNEMEDADSYEYFLEDLGNLLAKHCGGIRGNVGRPDFATGRDPGKDPEELGWTCGFHVDDSVPPDGGVYADYDTDITWQNHEENQG